MQETQEIAEEHWNTDAEGNLQGLYLIDHEQASGLDLWAKLDEIVKEYAKLHPEEMRIHLLETSQARSEINGDLAQSKKGLRWGLSLPPGLYFSIMAFEPAIFEERELYHQLLKRYPGFRICKTV
jgi:hypothetical protein